MEQLLLQLMRCPEANKYSGPYFSRLDSGRMELAQLPDSRAWRSPQLCCGRNGEPRSDQRTAIPGDLPGGQPDAVPAAGPVASRMYLHTGAKDHKIARSHPDPAQDRRNSAADGQQN